MLPLVAYAVFGSGRTLAVGPVAVVSLMTASALGQLAQTAAEQYLAAALVLAALSGVFLLALGLLGLGFIANLLSHPVISGFISASAILIAASQLKHILGLQAGGDTLPTMLRSVFQRAEEINWPTAAVGVGSLIFLLWANRSLAAVLKGLSIPDTWAELASKAAPALAVAATTTLAAALTLDEVGVKVVGTIPSGLPRLTLPPLEWSLWAQLAPAALLISVIGFVESISVAYALAAKRREKVDADRELVGLGAANIASALSGGFPVTGGFARSVVNLAAGAHTQLAGVFTAALIAVVAASLTSALYFMPQAVLAATIIAAVLRLVELRTLLHAWRYDRADAAALIATALGVLLFGVEAGIVTGVALSLAIYLWRTSRPHIALVGQVPGTEHYRNHLRHVVITHPQILTLRVDESLYFLNSKALERRIMSLAAEHTDARHVVLVLSAVNLIDSSALETLHAIAENLKTAGLTLHLAEVKGPVMDRLHRADFLDRLPGGVFLSTHAAVQSLTTGKVASNKEHTHDTREAHYR